MVHKSLSPATFTASSPPTSHEPSQSPHHLPSKSCTTDRCSTSVFSLAPRSSSSSSSTVIDPLQHKRRRRRRQRSTEYRYEIMQLDSATPPRPQPKEEISPSNQTIEWEETDVWRQELARRPEMSRYQLAKMIEAAQSLIALSSGSNQVIVDA
ncbi:hypothetical protein EC973_001510 [Apophysomyces ossiformis]|uniref:Uncharacterized protein n=1 Tax=Apophysomyces ossiformis TaxID=679940 RepID=A0A8H7BJI1_9FUNG|nr:hypothetical protein EC973_001510 [Apophysomyces ossiformis]